LIGLARTSFAAVFRTEVLLASKRVAPYVMLALFGANAWLWTTKGAAAHFGWATNGDFPIIHNLTGFTFLTLPLFTALVMGDPVGRDFRAGIAPLIFSKPLGRASYLLGKFAGNFFVLFCCQSAFILVLFVLQWFPSAGAVVGPVRVAPYVTHFLLLVVVSHLFLAAVHFTTGTLTRNPKIVYGMAVFLYPLYAVYQLAVLKALPVRWRVILDPLLMNWGSAHARGPDGNWLSAELINQLSFAYDADVLANRALVLLLTAACLAILYARFSTVEQNKKNRWGNQLTTIELVTREETLDRGDEGFDSARRAPELEWATPAKPVALPQVHAETEGFGAGLKQFAAATEVELRLLLAERSLVVVLPLAVLASVLGLAYYEAAPDPSYSAAYAARTAESFLLFMVAIAVFYTGEALHRDRELRVEPVVWSVPAPNFVLLLSKFSTTLLLSTCATLLVGAAAVALQLYKGHAPVELLAHLKTYAMILLPSAALLVAAVTAVNVLLREKYLAYAVCLAVAGSLFYLYSQGYNHWLYNPVLHGLWTPSDLQRDAPLLPQIITHRAYCLALTILFLSLTHLFFERQSNEYPRPGARLGGKGLTLLIASLAAAAAVLTGLMLHAGSRT
jgi:ABC-2 type transport system permease protein